MKKMAFFFIIFFTISFPAAAQTNTSYRIERLQNESYQVRAALNALEKKVGELEKSNKELTINNIELRKDLQREIEKQEVLVRSSTDNSNNNVNKAIETINSFNEALYESQILNTYILIGFLMLVTALVAYTLFNVKRMTKKALEKENHHFIKEKISQVNSDFERTLHGIVKNKINYLEKKVQDINEIPLPGGKLTYNELLEVGQQMLNAGKDLESLDYFDRAIKLKPEGYKALYYKGVVYNKLGNIEEALKNLDASIAIKPNMYESYNEKGLILLKKSDFQAALEVFNSVIKLNKDYAWAYNNKGIALYNLKRYDEAIEYFNKAIELKHNFSNAYHNRASSYLALKLNENAISDFSRAVELDGGLTTAHPWAI